jgi:hypothetical protein
LTLDPGSGMEKFGYGSRDVYPGSTTLLFSFRFRADTFKRKGLFILLRGRFESLEDIELRDRREKTEQREKDKKEKLRAERLKRMQAFQVRLFLVEDQKIFCFVSGEKYRNLCGAVFSDIVSPSTGSRIRIRLRVKSVDFSLKSAKRRTVNSMEQKT